jgi:aldose 1-epimerase
VEELRVADGQVEAVFLPQAGARLHRLRAFGHDLLRTPADTAVHARDPFFWGAYVMAPWCNRIAAEPVTVGSRTVTPQPNFPDGSAIHGQVYARPWEWADRTLRLLGGGDDWPWEYEVTLRVTATGAALRLACALANRSEEPMPAGIGLHPWWLRPVQLAVHAASVYPSNLEPTSRPEPVAGPFDLRRMAQPPDGLDATWTDLAPQPVELAWPDLGVRAALRASASIDHVVVATPPVVGAIAVELQTHAPGGLRRLLRGESGGLTMLRPGEQLELDVTLEFRRA